MFGSEWIIRSIHDDSINEYREHGFVWFIQWFVLSKDRVEIRIEMGSERVENGFEQRVYGFKQTGT